MNKIVEIDLLKHQRCLDDWFEDCRRRFSIRYPKIDFDAEVWPVRSLYKVAQLDWSFKNAIADFSDRDGSYVRAMRCLVAEMYLAGKPKVISIPIMAFRQLASTSASTIIGLTKADLLQLEEKMLQQARGNHSAAGSVRITLSTISRQTILLHRKGVLPPLGYRVRATTKSELTKLNADHRAKLNERKGELLNRRMEAFNEAFDRMVNGSPDISPRDRVALCTSALMLCAPSRINEVLCMSIEDYVTVDDYCKRTLGSKSVVYSAHQMLVVTMKGSKGADWSAKPVLNFMIDVFHYCMGVIKEHGKRSRMLVEWYQQHPEQLYLPPELEYLRGQAITRRELESIIRLDSNLPNDCPNKVATFLFRKLTMGCEKWSDSFSVRATSDLPGRNGVVAWAAVEALLLEKVHAAMDRCRRVTYLNTYQGDLAKMLFLFDHSALPFLPGHSSCTELRLRLKCHKSSKRKSPPEPSLFQKLGITMPIGNTIHWAEMDTHDPRRWLTTMAETYGERLSDVLINKWANRCSLSQLGNYDFRSPETLAAQSAMPGEEDLRELTDVSKALATMEALEDQFGLHTAIVTIPDADISMTSMDAVAEAIENRPVATSSRGIIILYPQRFGACLHQHHERPCRNYSNDLTAACLTCNDGVVTKGHIPTNDEIRKIFKKLVASIIRHLENLAIIHNRNIADDPAALGEHMVTLIEKGLSKDTIEQLAAHLIDKFHEINHLLKDRHLASRLEQAFVARGFVERLDDPEIPSGALMKYCNPTRHAAPLLELALEEHGGRERVARDEQALIEKYPQFAPNALTLRERGHSIALDGDESGD